jgi:hypothetical protein
MNKIFMVAMLLNCLFLNGCDPNNPGWVCVPVPTQPCTVVEGTENLCKNVITGECAMMVGVGDENSVWFECENCELDTFCSDRLCDSCLACYPLFCEHVCTQSLVGDPDVLSDENSEHDD